MTHSLTHLLTQLSIVVRRVCTRLRCCSSCCESLPPALALSATTIPPSTPSTPPPTTTTTAPDNELLKQERKKAEKRDDDEDDGDGDGENEYLQTHKHVAFSPNGQSVGRSVRRSHSFISHSPHSLIQFFLLAIYNKRLRICGRVCWVSLLLHSIFFTQLTLSLLSLISHCTSTPSDILSSKQLYFP